MNQDDSLNGRFERRGRLGKGNMGEVQLAYDKETGRLVALKGINIDDCYDFAVSELRLEKEAEVLKRLDHPGIVKFIETVNIDGRLFIVQEYIDGITLRQLINIISCSNHYIELHQILRDLPAEGSLDRIKYLSFDSKLREFPLSNETRRHIASEKHIRLCCELVRQAASALGHAHKLGVHHLDLKPENLMIGKDGMVRLIDFGIGRYPDGKNITDTYELLGTPAYMSPEHIAGREVVDAKSDVFSLGVVLYEALTLRPPYSQGNRMSIFKQIIMREMPPLFWFNSAVSLPLDGIVHKACEKNADKRYKSGGEFEQDITSYLQAKPISARYYRYKPKEKEIVLDRPARITVSAAIFFYLSVLSLMVILAHFTLTYPKETDHTISGIFITLTGVLGLASFRIAFGLLYAQFIDIIFAILLACVIGIGSLIFLIAGVNQSERLSFANIMFAISVICCSYIGYAVLSRSSRQWYKDSKEIRNEQIRPK